MISKDKTSQSSKEKAEKETKYDESVDSALIIHKKLREKRRKLEWAVHLVDRVINMGHTKRMKLHCSATSGGKTIEMKWFKDGKPIKYGKKIVDLNNGDYGSIWINELDVSDSGVYRVEATTDTEKIETQCKLTVTENYNTSKNMAPILLHPPKGE